MEKYMPERAGWRAFVAAGLLLLAGCIGSEPAFAAPKVSADFCDVARDPEHYEGSALTITGLVLGMTRDGAYLVGRHCPSVPFGVGDVANAELAMQMTRIIVAAARKSARWPMIPEISVEGRLRRVTALESGQRNEAWALDFKDIAEVRLLPRGAYAELNLPMKDP
jgi:hypothetical protein